MRAVRVQEFGGPEVMRGEEVPDLQPGPGQVVVRVKAAGVNPVDAAIRAGTYGRVSLPYTPGNDGAGVVAAVGEGATGRAIGQRVYFVRTLSGSYAEQALCQADYVHPLPDSISFSQGAALGVPYGTAYRGLFQRGQARAAEVVLVHGGSGGVGIAAVQFARAAGLTVIATAGSEEGRRVAAEQGAQQVLDHHDPQHFAQARGLTGGRGVDLIIELAAHANLGEDLKILAPQGRVIVIGSHGPVEINPGEAMGKELDLRGMTLMAATDRERAAMAAAIAAGLENGTLRPVVAEEFPLEEAPRAHREIMEEKHAGKIVLVP